MNNIELQNRINKIKDNESDLKRKRGCDRLSNTLSLWNEGVVPDELRLKIEIIAYHDEGIFNGFGHLPIREYPTTSCTFLSELCWKILNHQIELNRVV